MNPIDRLAELFKEFPGIGPRQARRFVYFLLLKNKNYTDEISRLIPELKNHVRTCSSCFTYFSKEKINIELCDICSNAKRDASKLMIVGRDTDRDAFEKSGTYNGMYFVLGGTLPILEEDVQKFIRVKELTNKILLLKDSLGEIIIALNANPDGDNTTSFLKKHLDGIKSENMKVSLLGRGLSTGSELEYADKDTLANAFENRR